MNTLRLRPGLKVEYLGERISTLEPGTILTVKKLEAAFGKRSNMWFTFVSFEETDQELSLAVIRPIKGKI